MATKTKLGDPLTERQREALAAIWRHLEAHGRYPSYRELMEALGVAGPNAVRVLLVPLERKGLLVMGHGPRAGPQSAGRQSYRLAGVRLAPVLADDDAGRRLAAELGLAAGPKEEGGGHAA
jgi:SOS-response transcriptional repressor LexA